MRPWRAECTIEMAPSTSRNPERSKMGGKLPIARPDQEHASRAAQGQANGALQVFPLQEPRMLADHQEIRNSGFRVSWCGPPLRRGTPAGRGSGAAEHRASPSPKRHRAPDVASPVSSRASPTRPRRPLASRRHLPCRGQGANPDRVNAATPSGPRRTSLPRHRLPGARPRQSFGERRTLAATRQGAKGPADPWPERAVCPIGSSFSRVVVASRTRPGMWTNRLPPLRINDLRAGEVCA